MMYGDMCSCLAKDGGTAFVACNITADGSAIAVLTGTPDAPEHELLLRSGVTARTLRAWFGQWRTSLDEVWRANGSSEAWDQRAAPVLAEMERDLFTGVWELAARRGARHIVIIPCGILQAFPLHLLPRQGGSEPPGYLLDEFTISYAPSFAVLMGRPQTTASAASLTWLGVGNPTLDLPLSELEVAAVRELFAPSQARVLAQRDATVAAVENAAPACGLLHFAGHGELGTDPFQSRLLLSLPDNGSPLMSAAAENTADSPRSGQRLVFRDGRSFTVDLAGQGLAAEHWTLDRILTRLRLPMTRLVVLSACESGAVLPEKLPEEYLSLATGFLAAGARAVVSSLWRVDDRASALLMERFYINWLNEGLPLHRALQLAQAWLRQRGPFASPAYWGAFQLAGW